VQSLPEQRLHRRMSSAAASGPAGDYEQGSSVKRKPAAVLERVRSDGELAAESGIGHVVQQILAGRFHAVATQSKRSLDAAGAPDR
jgi:hypothetical protein